MKKNILRPGADAPDFALLDHRAQSLALREVLPDYPSGVIILFFPSDFLPKDRKVLQAYRDAYPQLLEAGCGVLALSGINWEKLHRLALSDRLPFPLLFDACCRQAKRYGVMWIPKFINGRGTFLLDGNGLIVSSSSTLHLPQEVLDITFTS